MSDERHDESDSVGAHEPPGTGGGLGGDGASASSPLTEERSAEPRARDHVRWSKWREDVSVFSKNRLALVSFAFLVLIVLFCFVGPLLYRSNQSTSTLLNANVAPSAQFPLGTDPEGFDILGRLMLGGQSTIEVAFAVAVISTGFGAMFGALAGYIGGAVDSFLMRIVDTMLAIPFLFLAVLIATLLSPTLLIVTVAISAVSWQSTARIVRSETLSLRTRDYVHAATGFGSWHLRLVGRHILPNTIGSIVVNATLKVATAILLFAAVSFLGLGPPPPATSWGTMATVGVQHLYDNTWWELWPAVAAIGLTVIAVTLIGDGLYDVVARRATANRPT